MQGATYLPASARALLGASALRTSSWAPSWSRTMASFPVSMSSVGLPAFRPREVWSLVTSDQSPHTPSWVQSRSLQAFPVSAACYFVLLEREEKSL